MSLVSSRNSQASQPQQGHLQAWDAKAIHYEAGGSETGNLEVGYPEIDYPEASYPESGHPEAGYPEQDGFAQGQESQGCEKLQEEDLDLNSFFCSILLFLLLLFDFLMSTRAAFESLGSNQNFEGEASSVGWLKSIRTPRACLFFGGWGGRGRE